MEAKWQRLRTHWAFLSESITQARQDQKPVLAQLRTCFPSVRAQPSHGVLPSMAALCSYKTKQPEKVITCILCVCATVHVW